MIRLASLAVAAALAAAPAPAEAPSPTGAGQAEPRVVVAARAIRSRSVIGPGDVSVAPGSAPGAATDPEEVIGMEARVTLYAGRPIRPADLAPPALVERNQLVSLAYVRGAVRISADGRALDRAGLGERVRVMNLDSRISVTGRVVGPGAVEVGR